MKKVFILIAVTSIINTVLFAGGKITEPVETPAVDIPTPIVSGVGNMNDFYIGLGVVGANYKNTSCAKDCSYEDKTVGAMIKVGYDFNQYIGLEARAIGTFWKDDPLGGEKIRHYGIYAKFAYPITDKFSVYMLLGYGKTKTKTNNKNLPELNENGASAGLGVEYSLNGGAKNNSKKGLGVFVDYQKALLDSGKPDIDIVSAGVSYSF